MHSEVFKYQLITPHYLSLWAADDPDDLFTLIELCCTVSVCRTPPIPEVIVLSQATGCTPDRNSSNKCFGIFPPIPMSHSNTPFPAIRPSQRQSSAYKQEYGCFSVR